MGLVDDMAGAGLLNRHDESVPSREELLASPQRERGLPRPLLCVLLGYSKMSAFQLLLESDFPDSAAGQPFLDGYFPRLLRERFAAQLPGARAAARDRRHLRRQLPDQPRRRPAAAPARAGRPARDRRGGLRLDRGRPRGARRRRCARRCSRPGRPADEEQAALVEIEDALEAAARERLEGKKKTEAGRRCSAIGDRLGL